MIAEWHSEKVAAARVIGVVSYNGDARVINCGLPVNSVDLFMDPDFVDMMCYRIGFAPENMNALANGGVLTILKDMVAISDLGVMLEVARQWVDTREEHIAVFMDEAWLDLMCARGNADIILAIYPSECNEHATIRGYTSICEREFGEGRCVVEMFARSGLGDDERIHMEIESILDDEVDEGTRDDAADLIEHFDDNDRDDAPAENDSGDDKTLMIQYRMTKVLNQLADKVATIEEIVEKVGDRISDSSSSDRKWAQDRIKKIAVSNFRNCEDAKTWSDARCSRLDARVDGLGDQVALMVEIVGAYKKWRTACAIGVISSIATSLAVLVISLV